jgi:hypothetical protein
MRVHGFEKRIERAELAAKAKSKHSAECICFPENEPPFFAFEIELKMLTRVTCPIHGQRFKPYYRIYVARWLRLKQAQHLWTHHSEQYGKARFASFPPDLWPAEEEETGDGRTFLRLKDGTKLLALESARPRKQP